MRRVTRTLVATLCAALALGALVGPRAAAQDAAPSGETPVVEPTFRAALALAATLALDTKTAHRLLDGADPGEPAIALERARLALYEGDCDGAADTLVAAGLDRVDRGVELTTIAAGCARATAGTVAVDDEAHGVWVRVQDDEDRALVPAIAAVADAARAMLARELGTELPRPIRVELVRDSASLAALTGLPEDAAQTTGTVAVAKWGRVTMLTPRAMPHGYPWADTLAHELTHLTETAASRDRAPLWLQEGVAKRQETLWRPARARDDFPPADAIAKTGMALGLGRDIDKLGQSIALLPTAQHARVAYAEVASFVRHWVRENKEGALSDLLHGLRDASPDDALVAVSKAPLAEWSQRWSSWLASQPADMPPELSLQGAVPHEAEIRRAFSLAALLARRDHHGAAAKVLVPAQALAPHDAAIRGALARAFAESGRPEEAQRLVGSLEEVYQDAGGWWAMRGAALRDAGDAAGAATAFGVAAWLDPYEPDIACERRHAPETPAGAEHDALCRAARAIPRD